MRRLPFLALALLPLLACAGKDTSSDSAGSGSDAGTDTADNVEAPAQFGPDNRWPHATTDEVPEGLTGTGIGVGDVIPDFTLVDQDGNEVELYQFYGRVVQLVLFAQWCGPCNEEAPTIQAASVDLAADDVVVLGVMMENVNGASPATSDLGDWVTEYGVTHPLVAGPGDLTAMLQGGYPTHPVIDREMRVAVLDNFPFDADVPRSVAAQ